MVTIQAHTMRPATPQRTADQAVSGADSYDGPRDGVGGADGNAREGGGKQSDGADGFGAKPANGFELGDSLPHGFYDAPTAEVGSGGDGGIGGKE
jgi:hypothetical protein